ncbi:MAG: NAD-dependent epimerase/dehydratase family protein [Thermoleophilia bacterium]
MRVLITGGAGFIGSSLALRLVDAGHEVAVLDALLPQIHGPNPATDSPLLARIEGRVELVHGSVTDRDAWTRALADQQVVVHLAAETGTGQSMYEVHRYADTNVGGTSLMLEVLAAGGHRVEKVVVASTRALYGEGRYVAADGSVHHPSARLEADMAAGRFGLYHPDTGEELRMTATDESSVIHPASVYGITKQAQEQLVMAVCPTLGIAPTALRYQNVFGPGQSLTNPYTGILSIFSTRALNGQPILVFEDGEESRDFVSIDDVVDATLKAITDDRANGEVFGIGSGVATSVLTAARTLVAALEVDVPIEVTGAFRLGDIRHNVADLTKAERLLGYRPKVDFQTGVRRFVEWVRTQPVQRDDYQRSIDELRSRGLMRG